MYSSQLVAVVSLLLASALAGCGQERPERLIASAKTYLAENQPKAAAIQLKNALQQSPDSAEARFLLAKALLAAPDPVAAVIEVEKAIKLKHPADETMPLLARALLMQGQHRKVADELSTVDLTAAAAVADLKTSVAIAYVAQGDPVRAQAALASALAVAPEDPRALVIKARLQAASGNVSGAFAMLEAILAKEPAHVDALVLKAELLAARRELDPAEEAYRKVLAAAPGHADAHAGIVSMRMARRDLPGAKDQLAVMRKENPGNPLVAYYDGVLALQEGNIAAAREVAQKLLRIAPDHVRVLQFAAAVETAPGGSVLRAEQHLTRALQMSPNAALTRQLLAQVYIRAGLPDKALTTLKPLMDADLKDPDLLSLAASAHMQSGNPGAAEDLFKQASELRPKDARTQTALSLMHLAKGEGEAALGELRAIADKDTGIVADMALINARLARKDVKGALEAIARLEKKQPDKPAAAHLRGQVLVANGDAAGARQAFERALTIDPGHFPSVLSLSTLDMRDGKPEASSTRIEKFAKDHPKHAQALVALAGVRDRRGDPKEEVAALLAQAIALNPADPGTRLVLVEHHLRQKDSKAALEAAQNAIAAMPDQPELLNALGRAQLASGDHNQAMASFNRVAALQPKSPGPHLALADAHVARGDREAAIQSLDRALSVSPMLLAAQQNKLAIYLAQGKHDEALGVARTVKTQRPKAAIGFAMEGDVEAVQKRWAPAAAAYRAALQKQPASDVAVKLHNVLLTSGKREEASSFAADWVGKHPKDTAFLVQTGNRALADGNYAEAERRYMAVLQIQPNHPVALNNLAWAALRAGKPGAVAHAEKANRLQPGQPAMMDTWAKALAAEKRLDEAIDIQKKAVELQPKNPQLRFNLAKLYASAGKKDLARKELQALERPYSAQKEVQQLLDSL